MAVDYRSVSTSSGIGSNTPVVVTKPSGLTVGDLMVAHCTSGALTWNTPTDWTLAGFVDGAQGSTLYVYIFHKYATAADVAATDFTFTTASGSDVRRVGLYAVQGAKVSSPITIGTIGNGSGTSVSVAGITPAANSLLLGFVSYNNDSGAVSGYAIATSNPTWTERYDENGNQEPGMASASALRPESTATGNFTATASPSMGWVAVILSIAPADNVSFESPTFLQQLTLYMVPPVVLPFQMTVSLLEVVVSKFTALAKNAASWINQSKS